MLEAQTVIAFPGPAPHSGRVRVRTRNAAKDLRSPARVYPSPVVPMFGARPHLRGRSHAGLGVVIAFGFSILCWAGLAAAIF